MRTRPRSLPPLGHPLRVIKRLSTRAISELLRAADPPALPGARPLGAAQVLHALLLQALHSVPNERLLRDVVRGNPSARWFIGLGDSDPLWTADVFGRSRVRLFASGFASSFFRSVLKVPAIAGVLLDDRLRPDAKLLEAWAGHEGCQPGGEAIAVSSLLLLPEAPDAMWHLPCLVGARGRSPLEPVLRRLGNEVRGQLTVACRSDATAVRIAPIVERCGARVLRLAPGPLIAQLVSAAAQLQTAHLAIWAPAATLLPDGLIQRLCDHHLQHDNDVTRPAALPEGARVEIFSTAALHRLRAEAPATIDLAPGRCLDWAQSVARLRLRLEDWRHAEWLEPIPVDLSRRIAVDAGDDWRRLAEAVNDRAVRQETDSWRPLRAWRNAAWLRPVSPRRTRRTDGRTPRVLFVTPSTAFSGPERMYARLANGLLDRRVDLWGLLVRPGMIASLVNPAHRDRLISDDVEFARPTLASFEYCLEVFRRVRADVIHCNGIPTWPVLAAADVCRTPVLQHVRVVELDGLDDRLRKAERLIAVSRFAASELARIGADPERVRVCYNGVDLAHLRPSAAARRAGRRLFGIAAATFVLLCIARCVPSKRIDVVIRAFAEATRTRRDACLLIVGEIDDPLYYESLQQEISARRLGSRVRFLTAVEDIRALHAAADALMLASVREPFGNAVLEAMAMQTPVIVSASGGIPEMVDGSCGTLVDPASTDGFGAALRRVADEDVELRSKARHARQVVRRRFNLDDHVEAIRQLYLEVSG